MRELAQLCQIRLCEGHYGGDGVPVVVQEALLYAPGAVVAAIAYATIRHELDISIWWW